LSIQFLYETEKCQEGSAKNGAGTKIDLVFALGMCLARDRGEFDPASVEKA
jgi:hypothetical protein